MAKIEYNESKALKHSNFGKLEYIKKANSDDEVFDSLNKVSRKWFKNKFGKFSEAQRYSMVNIRDRKNILVSSPTGSGKTGPTS